MAEYLACLDMQPSQLSLFLRRTRVWSQALEALDAAVLSTVQLVGSRGACNGTSKQHGSCHISCSCSSCCTPQCCNSDFACHSRHSCLGQSAFTMYIANKLHADLNNRANVVCSKATRANLLPLFDLAGSRLGGVFEMYLKLSFIKNYETMKLCWDWCCNGIIAVTIMLAICSGLH